MQPVVDGKANNIADIVRKLVSHAINVVDEDVKYSTALGLVDLAKSQFKLPSSVKKWLFQEKEDHDPLACIACKQKELNEGIYADERPSTA